MNDGILIKEAQGSANRAGFLSDVAGTRYHESMAQDVFTIISNYLCPGFMQVNINWSDVPVEAIDLGGFIALICKLIFAYNEEYYVSSISRESV